MLGARRKRRRQRMGTAPGAAKSYPEAAQAALVLPTKVAIAVLGLTAPSDLEPLVVSPGSCILSRILVANSVAYSVAYPVANHP